MNKKFQSLFFGLLGILLAEAAIAFVLEFVFHLRLAVIMIICIVVDLFYALWILFVTQNEDITSRQKIRNVLDETAADAIVFGDVGYVTFNENYVIEWMSDLFQNRNIDFVGEKLTSWIPEVAEVFHDDIDQVIVTYDERKYLVQRKSSGGILYFKDVTENENNKLKLKNQESVIGLIHLDNYSETIQFEDEQKISLIHSNIRQRVADWCHQYGMVARRIRSDRFVVFTDQEHFQQASKSHFSILNEVRKEASALEVAITVSMAFVWGNEDYSKLDEMVNGMLELAQNRGGDQVALKPYNGEVSFVGGTVESSEKRSGVRVRVMAQSIRGLIENSDQVFILGHKTADFDCMGGALGVSRMALSLGKETSIVLNGLPLETKLSQVMEKYHDALEQVHSFMDESTALARITDKSLVISVDHHTEDLCATPKVLQAANRTLVIDHHRRRKDDNIRASMIYLEAGASSTVELVTELLQYQPQSVVLIEEEANIMLAGMVVDTNHFRNRTNPRTFSAASQLRQWGADPREVDELLKNTYQEFEMQTKMLAHSQRIFDDYIIVPIDDAYYTRTQISEVADFLLSIQGVKASFVIASIAENVVAVSSRSAGEVNVQVIMEQMHGGGHFSGAALQREDTTVSEVTEELIKVIGEYVEKERQENESNLID